MTDLKNQLLESFPGKMENRQVFIMTFAMNQAQKGSSPPPKAEIEKAIEEMISDGIFEEKGNLLILKSEKTTIINIAEEEEEVPLEESSSTFNPQDYPEIQLKILEAFQGKFENRTAIIMNVTMKEAQAGRSPPAKNSLEEAIDELIEKGTLDAKGNMLIKKT
ncbi:MAG: hypothetical protein ACFE95_02085 [Candidatus Hodarchaeota archaeon]